MGILVNVFRQIRAFEVSAKIALGVAVILLLILLVVSGFAPESLRNVSLFSAGVMVIVVQVIIMWGNRNMVVPYTQAQRQFVAGDFEGVRDTVLTYLAECEKQGKRPHVDALTLLGNAYRNMGQIEQSQMILQDALQIKPSYYFPLYGLGRTLMVKGDYAGAEKMIRTALSAGAPRGVLFDLGHALYRLERPEAVETLAQVEKNEQEPHRLLMARYWLNRIQGTNTYILDSALLTAGLPFWKAEADRFAQTPYGLVLQRDLLAPELSSQEN